jgi:hypothetical protein
MMRAVALRTRVAGPRFAAARLLHGSVPQRKQRAAEEPLPPSLVDKYKLDDPTRYVPLTVTGFGLGWATGLYHFDAETQILALWVLFCTTVYSRGGPVISGMLDEMANDIEKEQKAAEEAQIEAVKLTLAAYKGNKALVQDVKELFEGQNALMAKIGAGASNRLKHGVRDAYVRKLESLVRAEEKAAEQQRAVVLAAAKSFVSETFTGSEPKNSALRAASVEAAIAALGNPKTAKRPAQVAQAYSSFFESFDEELKAQSGKAFDVTAAAQKEIRDAMEQVARREELDVKLVNVPAKTTLQLF